MLLYCSAGCDTKDVLSKLGLTQSHLYPKQRRVETYIYTDESGEQLYRVVRWEYPKKFTQERWNPDTVGG